MTLVTERESISTLQPLETSPEAVDSYQPNTTPIIVPSGFLRVFEPVSPLSIKLAEAIDNTVAQERERIRQETSKLASEIPNTSEEGAAIAVRSITEELAHSTAAMQLAALRLQKILRSNPDPAIQAVVDGLEYSYQKTAASLADNLETAHAGNISFDQDVGINKPSLVLRSHHSSQTRAKQRHLLASLAFHEAGFNMGTIARVPLGAGR